MTKWKIINLISKRVIMKMKILLVMDNANRKQLSMKSRQILIMVR